MLLWTGTTNNSKETSAYNNMGDNDDDDRTPLKYTTHKDSGSKCIMYA